MADAQSAGDVGDGGFAVLEQPGWGDVVVVAHVGDGGAVEGPSGAGDISSRVEPLGELAIGELAQTAGHLDGGGIGVSIFGDVLAAGDDQLVGGAGVPADPDTGLGVVDLGQQSDIGDEGAQQAFAVPGGGAGSVPEASDVTG